MAFSPYRSFAAKLRADGFVFRKYNKLGMRVINKSGSDIARDQLVAVVGYDTTSKLPKIVLADADDATHIDVWVTLDRGVTNNKEGFVYKGGLSAASLNTNSATSAGDPVYLSGTAGGFVHTADPTKNVIPVGFVVVKSATVGQIHWSVSMGVVASGVQDVVVASMNVAAGAAAADYDGRFFIADRAYEVVGVREQHQTLGTDGGAVTLMVKKVPSGTAKAAGTDLLSAGINLKAANDTVQSGALHGTQSNLQLAAGDSLGLVTTGTLTAVDGVSVTVFLKKL